MRKHYDLPSDALLQLPICSPSDSPAAGPSQVLSSNIVELESYATAAFHPRKGGRIDHFHLLRELGEGTFGRVWLARDMGLNRVVAIKFPKFNLAANRVSTRDDGRQRDDGRNADRQCAVHVARASVWQHRHAWGALGRLFPRRVTVRTFDRRFAVRCIDSNANHPTGEGGRSARTPRRSSEYFS